MIPEYKYQVKDYSIVTPAFKRLIVSPLMRFMPWSVPANIITVVSNIFMYLALALSFFWQPESRINFLIIPFLVIAYAIGDHFDGMQAKRTKTSSALGEFFDHNLDVYNNGSLLMTVFNLFGIINPWLLAFYFGIGYIAHATVFQEQADTGWLIFEKFGSLETVFLLCAVMAIGFWSSAFEFITMPVYENYTLLEIVFVFSSIGAIGTVAQTIARAKLKTWQLYVFWLALGVVSLLSAVIYHSALEVFILITLYSGLYISNLQKGHLVDKKKRAPDFVVPVLLVFAYFLPTQSRQLVLYAIYFYLSAYVGYIIVSSIYKLREFWVWKNHRS